MVEYSPQISKHPYLNMVVQGSHFHHGKFPSGLWKRCKPILLQGYYHQQYKPLNYVSHSISSRASYSKTVDSQNPTMHGTAEQKKAPAGESSSFYQYGIFSIHK